jgi:hypothetical protein
VVHWAGSFARQILEEGTTKRDVDELNAAADPQDGQTPLAGDRKERQLEQVALLTRWSQMRGWFSAVPRWIDVLPSREQEPITAVQRRGGEGSAHEGREDQRHAAGGE